MANQGTLFIVSSPSGGGKTSLVAAVIARLPHICSSISYTTRAPRAGEQEGRDYYFIDLKQFNQLVAEGVFLEHAQVYGYAYGTRRAWIEAQLAKGMDVILTIDWQGARLVKAQLPHSCSIFILPPSREAIMQRLRARNQDSDAVIVKRMAVLAEQIQHGSEFDYVIVNQSFEQAISDIGAIIQARRLTVERQWDKLAELMVAVSVDDAAKV